jgi:hypothetical protein
LVDQALDHQLLLGVVAAKCDELIDASSCSNDGVACGDTCVSGGEASSVVDKRARLQLIKLSLINSFEVSIRPTLKKDQKRKEGTISRVEESNIKRIVKKGDGSSHGRRQTGRHLNIELRGDDRRWVDGQGIWCEKSSGRWQRIQPWSWNGIQQGLVGSHADCQLGRFLGTLLGCFGSL